MNYRRFDILCLSCCLLLASPCYTRGLLNKGQMYIRQTSSSTSMYIDGDWQNIGDKVSVFQKGNTLLTGDFVNEVTDGNIFVTSAQDSTVIFAGSDKQCIRGGKKQARDVNYADFSNIRVNNPAGLWIADSMRVQVGNLYLPGGRLVLESDTVSGKRESSVAHLLVKDAIYYNRNNAIPNDPSQGIVQVNLALGNNYKGKKLIGFSSPFKTLYADYFTYNFLSKPSPAGLFGDTGMLIEDIRTPLKAGEGYLVGQGIIDDEQYYDEQLDPQWQGALFADRATTQFSFARNFLPASLGQFLTEAKHFNGEELNITDVQVALNRQGFHYVGNPFTCAIDLSSFLDVSATRDVWGVTRSADGTAEMRNNFYVMSGGTGQFYPENSYGRFKFSVSYLIGQSVGSTISIDTNTPYIAPMQMFIVGKNENTPTSFNIPASARVVDRKTNFLRSASMKNSVTDEILLEVVDQDTKAYDRLCVVFREGASLNATDKYDASKLFNYSKGVSQIYTKSAENKNMTTNVISTQTQSLPLYLDACSDTKTVAINAHRLESLQGISYLFLEDKKTKEIVDLLQHPTYSFTTTPDDNSERFILHFTRVLTDMENATTRNLQVYYADATLYIKGLSQEDEGSRLTVSDMQGYPVHQSKITQSPDMNIAIQIPTGVYIVKVSGKNNYTLKIITP